VRSFLVAAVGTTVVFFNTGTGDDENAAEMASLMEGPTGEAAKALNAVATVETANGENDSADEEGASSTTSKGDENEDSDDADDQAKVPTQKGGIKLRDRPCNWRYQKASKAERKDPQAPRMFLKIEYRNNAEVTHLAWHHRGDYLASACPKAVSTAVVFHILSKPGKSQCPFASVKGVVQRVRFHPSKPIFFLATRHSVRIYNLQKASLVKKLNPNVKWLSSIDVHPSGDHVICGSYDCVVNWFDLDLSTTPYKALRYHKNGVRGTVFHPRYPLMAT